MRPRGRDGATFTHFLSVCKKCVVFSAMNSRTAALSSRLGELQVYWWCHALALQMVPNLPRKGFNSLVVLVAWWIWKHMNGCIFEGFSPNLAAILWDIRDEAMLWCMAGAKGLCSRWP